MNYTSLGAPVFRAVFDNGVILEWYRPQTWRRVFRAFKTEGNMEESRGTLYCGDVKLRETGYDAVKFFMHDT